MKCLQRVSKSQLNNALIRNERKLLYEAFLRHSVLSIEILGSDIGLTDKQIQLYLNKLLNNYDCLAQGYGTFEDSAKYVLEKYGIELKDGYLYTNETEFDKQIEDDILRENGVIE